MALTNSLCHGLTQSLLKVEALVCSTVPTDTLDDFPDEYVSTEIFFLTGSIQSWCNE